MVINIQYKAQKCRHSPQKAINPLNKLINEVGILGGSVLIY